ncbi:MAG: hypothetical protein K2X87_31135 [Gemmataceae bacterium]|nr:hypothetical protein [Gemmataceae bacterium]
MTTETPRHTIDLTGLPPHAIQAIEAVVAAFRSANGRSANWPDPPPMTPEERVALWKEWVRAAAVPGVIADDSREAIYDRSTE